MDESLYCPQLSPLSSYLSTLFFSPDEITILADLTGQPASYWWTRTVTDIPDDQRAEWQRRQARWAQGEPLAYVLGHMDWYGRRFKVTPDVLIPRPETELMVDIIKEHYQPGDGLLDVGTGSGCIATTLSLELNAPVQAVDISPAALAVARENATHWGAVVTFTESDLLSNLALVPGQRYLVAANLPYVPENDWPALDSSVRAYEPRLALVAEKQGLALYYQLIAQLERGRLAYRLVGEIDPPQAAILAADYPTMRFINDYTHRPRFFYIESAVS